MKVSHFRGFCEQILHKLQDLRANLQFSHTLSQNLRALLENLENYLFDKDFCSSMRESLFATCDVLRLASNNGNFCENAVNFR